MSFDLKDRAVSVWDIDTHAWAVQRGVFRVMVGESSEDIRLVGSLELGSSHGQ